MGKGGLEGGAGEGHFYGEDFAVGVEAELVDAGHAVVAVGGAERVAVVNDVILAGLG